MWALGALDAGLLANAAHPLVRAGRRVARLSGLPTLEAARVDIGSPPEERPEERDLRLGRGAAVDHDLSYALQSPARKPPTGVKGREHGRSRPRRPRATGFRMRTTRKPASVRRANGHPSPPRLRAGSTSIGGQYHAAVGTELTSQRFVGADASYTGRQSAPVSDRARFEDVSHTYHNHSIHARKLLILKRRDGREAEGARLESETDC
jgi:hypothetical protein